MKMDGLDMKFQKDPDLLFLLLLLLLLLLSFSLFDQPNEKQYMKQLKLGRPC
jgi:hypothetical protein